MKVPFDRLRKVIKTRGFWVVNVVWFVSGGIFFSTLPHPKETGDWLNDLLAQTLIIIILAPIYWTLVQDFSESLNRFIDTILTLFKK